MSDFKCSLLLLLVCSLCTVQLQGQEIKEAYVIDDLQIDVKAISLDQKKDTITIDFFLISYHKGVREFKLNTYATQIIDNDGAKHMCANMRMGRVLVSLADRQNYLHYLLEENLPVPFRLQVSNWGDKEPSKVVFVFEDSNEEGKFIEAILDLKKE